MPLGWRLKASGSAYCRTAAAPRVGDGIARQPAAARPAAGSGGGPLLPQLYLTVGGREPAKDLRALARLSEQNVDRGGSLLQRQQQRRQRGRCWRVAAQQQGQGDDDGLDLVERLVGKLFGQKALDDPTPGGLKRLSGDASKELYPAVTDRVAQPVAGDGEDVAALRPLLAQTQLESCSLRLAYDAEIDGWSASKFHERVDGFGASLVVAETEGGAVIGGYNPRGWVSLGEDRDSIAAFLFTWRDGDVAQRPVKLPKVGGAALAVVRDQVGQGIFLGPDGLHIPLAPGNERLAKNKLGPYYSRLPDGGNNLFAVGESAKAVQLTNLRVYVREGEGEQWELDGIVWKTKAGP